MKKLYLDSFETERGVFRLAATDKGLAIIAFPSDDDAWFNSRIARYFPDYEYAAGVEKTKPAKRQLIDYLSGKRRTFDLRLDIQGTVFQQKVLARVSQIPYGQTMTYGEVAAAIGHPRAHRAVGSANANNILPLVIPCHRVVASNGIGGYGGGEKFKEELLRQEGAIA